MSQIRPMWMAGSLLFCLMVLGSPDESPENIINQEGQTVTFKCNVKGKNVSSVLFSSILTNGLRSNITCPGQLTVFLDARIQAECHAEKDGIPQATWTIQKVTKSDNGSQVICSAPGLPNAKTVLTVEASKPVAVTETVFMVGTVVGGFLGTLLFFALIACCLICYAHCKGSQDDDKDKIETSFSNPSWTGSSDVSSDKIPSSSENEYEDPVKLFPNDSSLKSCAGTGAISGPPESITASQ
ncbi:uncharacterized protein [Ambystoma mexicanum]|uniref:uncharacterized protein n=1 Tax=Ambystoma mexicanum TaxID=8296 RepID=UPI0037E8D890